MRFCRCFRAFTVHFQDTTSTFNPAPLSPTGKGAYRRFPLLRCAWVPASKVRARFGLADALPHGGDAGRVLFQRFGADGAHVRTHLVFGEGAAVVGIQVRVERGVAQFGIVVGHCQQVLRDVVARRVELWRAFEAADNGSAGARDVRVFRRAFRLEARQRVGFDDLFEQGGGVARHGGLCRTTEGVVKEVVGDGEGVVDVDAIVGDEGRHLREGVFCGEFGRGRRIPSFCRRC